VTVDTLHEQHHCMVPYGSLHSINCIDPLYAAISHVPASRGHTGHLWTTGTYSSVRQTLAPIHSGSDKLRQQCVPTGYVQITQFMVFFSILGHTSKSWWWPMHVH